MKTLLTSLLFFFKNDSPSTKGLPLSSWNWRGAGVKWLLWLLTLATGIVIGTVLKDRQIHRLQQQLDQNQATARAFQDSLRTLSTLAAQSHTIHTQHETILSLRQRLRSDSITHLTELQALRAIQLHLQKK